MTIPDTSARTPFVQSAFVFPEPPEDHDDKMTNYDQMAETGNTRYLAIHLGNPETTLVVGERYLALAPTRDMTGLTYPDLLVAFDVKPEYYRQHNAYVISEQGKPPDLVLEIASRSSGQRDVAEKREIYAGLLIPEYWRFDETGRYHGVRPGRGSFGKWGVRTDRHSRVGRREFAGVQRSPEPEPALSGRTPYVEGLARGLPRGRLGWHDPTTGQHIATYEDETGSQGRRRSPRRRSAPP